MVKTSSTIGTKTVITTDRIGHAIRTSKKKIRNDRGLDFPGEGGELASTEALAKSLRWIILIIL